MNNEDHMKSLAHELAHRPLGVVIAETSFISLIALTAVLGNSCVLYVFYKTPRLQTVTSYYLIALAISDIAKSILVMPATIAATACGCDFVGRKVGEVVHWVSLQLLFSSMAISMLIAINRYFCVNKPIKYKKYFKPKCAKLTLVLSGLLMTPFILIGQTQEHIFKFHAGWLIYMPWSPNQTTNVVFNIFFEIFLVVIPVTLSGYCYWKVYKRITSHIAAVAPSLIVGNGSAISIEEANITRTLTAIVVCSAIFWLPSSIVYHMDSYVDLPRYVEMIHIYAWFLYSVVNPVVYNAFNKTFRREFAKLFWCLKRTETTSNPPLQTFKMTAALTKTAINSTASQMNP